MQHIDSGLLEKFHRDIFEDCHATSFVTEQFLHMHAVMIMCLLQTSYLI